MNTSKKAWPRAPTRKPGQFQSSTTTGLSQRPSIGKPIQRLIEGDIDAIEEEAAERIAAIKEEIAARVAAENERLEEMVAGIRLPPAALPEVELPEKPSGAVLVSSEWSWAAQTRALKAHKTYGEGEP